MQNVLYAELAHLESRLVDTSGLRSCSEDILLRRYVVLGTYPLDSVEKAIRIVSARSCNSSDSMAYYGAESMR